MNTTTTLEPKGIADLLRELVRHESARGMQSELLGQLRRVGRSGQGARSTAEGRRPEFSPLDESPAGRELRWVLRRELAFQLRVAAKLRLARGKHSEAASCAAPTKAELASLRAGFAQTALACISSDLETCSAAVLAHCVLHPMDAWPQASELAAESLLARDCAAGRYLLGQTQLSVGADRRALRTFLGALVAAEQAAQERRIPAHLNWGQRANWAQRALESEASPEPARSTASPSLSKDEALNEWGGGLREWTNPLWWDAERMGPHGDFGERIDGSWIHLGLSEAHHSAGWSSLALGSARSALKLARVAERDTRAQRTAARAESSSIRIHQPLQVVHAAPSARFEACASCFYLAGFELPRESALEFVAELDHLALSSSNGTEQLRKGLERRLSMTSVSRADMCLQAQLLLTQMQARNSPARGACQYLVGQLE